MQITSQISSLLTNVNFGRKAQSSGLHRCTNGKTVPLKILQGIQKFHSLMHYYRLEAIWDYFKNWHYLKSQYLGSPDPFYFRLWQIPVSLQQNCANCVNTWNQAGTEASQMKTIMKTLSPTGSRELYLSTGEKIWAYS